VDTKNQLTNATPVGNQTYDGNGNVTAWQSGSYSYDDENRLTSAQVYSSWKTDFVYDGLGRLRSRAEYGWTGSSWYPNGTTYYIYDGMRVIQERVGSPTVSYTRGTDLSGTLEGAGGIRGLLARSHGYASSNGNWYVHNCYHADGNGNITYLVNSSQTLAASYRYDPYGNTISSSGTLGSANVYRFSSKELHVNSGLYYYGYRWYSPSLQRWLNRDPLGEFGFETSRLRTSGARYGASAELLEGPNLYWFVHNNPNRYIDPDGRPAIAIPIAGGIAIGEGIALGAGICLLIPACRDNLVQLANEALRGIRDLCRARPNPRRDDNDEDCQLVDDGRTSGMCRYWCPKSFTEKTIPVPSGGCLDVKKKKDFPI
jgi:RHS repeat-associated protein